MFKNNLKWLKIGDEYIILDNTFWITPDRENLYISFTSSSGYSKNVYMETEKDFNELLDYIESM